MSVDPRQGFGFRFVKFSVLERNGWISAFRKNFGKFRTKSQSKFWIFEQKMLNFERNFPKIVWNFVATRIRQKQSEVPKKYPYLCTNESLLLIKLQSASPFCTLACASAEHLLLPFRPAGQARTHTSHCGRERHIKHRGCPCASPDAHRRRTPWSCTQGAWAPRASGGASRRVGDFD